MPVYHPGSRITHHVSDSLSHGGFVAVHRTFRTGGLAFPEGAFLQALQSVFVKLLACGAKLMFATVLFAAIKGYHNRHGFTFPSKARSRKMLLIQHVASFSVLFSFAI